MRARRVRKGLEKVWVYKTCPIGKFGKSAEEDIGGIFQMEGYLKKVSSENKHCNSFLVLSSSCLIFTASPLLIHVVQTDLSKSHYVTSLLTTQQRIAICPYVNSKLHGQVITVFLIWHHFEHIYHHTFIPTPLANTL